MIRRLRDRFARFMVLHRADLGAARYTVMVSMSVLYGLILALVPPIFLMWLMYNGRDSEALVRHAITTKAAVSSLREAVSRAIYHHRNYLLTNRRSSRDNMVEWERLSWRRSEVLHRLTRGDQYQAARCSALDDVMAEKFAFMDRIVDDRVDFGTERAVADIVTGNGEALVSRFDRIADLIGSEEDVFLYDRERLQARWIRGLWLTIGMIFLLNIFLLYIWFRALYLRVAADQADYHRAVADPTAPI